MLQQTRNNIGLYERVYHQKALTMIDERWLSLVLAEEGGSE